MKVLFIGEFSGVYSELIPALRKENIEVFHIGPSDDYKGYKSNLDISRKTKHNVFFIIFNLLGVSGLLHFCKIWDVLKKVSTGYDVVQINCPRPFNYGYLILIWYYFFLKNNNESLYLSVLGANYYVTKYQRKIQLNRSCRKKMAIKDKIAYYQKLFLMYLPSFYLTRICKAIMPCSILYKNAYGWSSKVTNVVPLSILSDKIGMPLCVSRNDTIKIFHGWQIGREKDKGNDIFDRVIMKVKEKYGDKIEYQVVHNVPYEDYIHMFQGCHIFIDQLYATDKGMNGLLGMAAGKVVFSGFKKEALECYSGYDGSAIGIASHDDEEYLFGQFCNLIEQPELINTISNNAISFVKKYHTSDIVIGKYLNIWCNGK